MTAISQEPKESFPPGVIVKCRKWDWVLFPSDDQ